MSSKEECMALLNDFSESQLVNVAAMLQAMKRVIQDTIVYDIPNAETIAAIRELENGSGELWTGSTEDLFAMLDAEDENA